VYGLGASVTLASRHGWGKLPAMLFQKSESVLTACPKQHERILVVLSKTPMQQWTLTCPICGEENQIVTKEIVKALPS
jgi:hypothetical protein